VNTSDCISSIQNLIQFFVIVKSSLIQLWLSIGSLFQLWLSKGSLLELSLSREVSFLCDWATCNLTLHFSGTLLGSTRGTWLLPVCGRNLYNCLCSLFLCSILFYPLHKTLNSLRLWTSSDSEPENSSWTKEKRSFFFKHTIQPPLLVVFLTFTALIGTTCILHSQVVVVSLHCR